MMTPVKPAHFVGPVEAWQEPSTMRNPPVRKKGEKLQKEASYYPQN